MNFKIGTVPIVPRSREQKNLQKWFVVQDFCMKVAFGSDVCQFLQDLRCVRVPSHWGLEDERHQVTSAEVSSRLGYFALPSGSRQ